MNKNTSFVLWVLLGIGFLLGASFYISPSTTKSKDPIGDHIRQIKKDFKDHYREQDIYIIVDLNIQDTYILDQESGLQGFSSPNPERFSSVMSQLKENHANVIKLSTSGSNSSIVIWNRWLGVPITTYKKEVDRPKKYYN